MSNTICTPLDFDPLQFYAYLTKFFVKLFQIILNIKINQRIRLCG